VTPFKPTLLDRTVLVYHVSRGAQLPELVGYEDCEIPRAALLKRLALPAIQRRTLESALWSCNLMDEAGQWWSPAGETCKQFIDRVSADVGLKFDYFYNYFKEPREQGNK
jgi:hypothetical protein